MLRFLRGLALSCLLYLVGSDFKSLLASDCQAARPTLVHRGGFLEVFTASNDGHLWYCYHRDGDSPESWSGWTNLAGGIAGGLATIHRQGFLELFTTGSDHHLWYTSHRDGSAASDWAAWKDLGEGIASRPTLIHRHGYLELFVKGIDGHLWYKYHLDGDSADAWSSWSSLVSLW